MIAGSSVMFLLAALGTCVTSSMAAEIAVIVSANSQITHINPVQLADVYLGKANFLPGAEYVDTIDYPQGTSLQEEFCRKVLGRDPAKVRIYWSRQIYTGKARPPKELPNASAVKGAVAANPYAVGYIDKNALDSTVRAILVVQ